MPDIIRNLTHSDYLILGGGFAGLSGGVSYLLKNVEGKPFKWSEFFLHVLASMIFGLIAFEFASFEGVPDELCGAIAGCAGWLGTRIARIAEVLLLKRLGLQRKELE